MILDDVNMVPTSEPKLETATINGKIKRPALPRVTSPNGYGIIYNTEHNTSYDTFYQLPVIICCIPRPLHLTGESVHMTV